MGIKLNVLKGIAGFGAAVGTGVLIDNLARAVTPVDAKKIHKVFVRIGAFGLGGYLGEKAGEYVTESIDDVAAIFGVVKKAKKDFKESIVIINNAEAPKDPGEDTQTDAKTDK